ncbi:MAG TPA: nuclear transport factor 2 family protein [Saprospiraceae bacterium]|nr:nuclear transport factor 2 family protein [Saprospiraceae bacterium]
MRKTIFLLILSGILQLSAFGQNKLAESVLQFELKRFEAMTRADTTALRAMLSEDLMYVHSNALIERKQDHLNAIAAKKLIYKSMKREQANVRLYGKTAVVNGTVAVQGVLQNNDFALRLLYTAIYRKKGKHWHLVNWQSTKIP